MLPVLEILRLFETIVRPCKLVLLGFTALICLVSGISILVSIYNSMSDRRHEIAVMRALGAESRHGDDDHALGVDPAVAGRRHWAGSAAMRSTGSPVRGIEAQTGVTVGFWNLAPPIHNLDLWGLESIISWISPEA